MTARRTALISMAWIASAAVVCVGCKREERSLRPPPPTAGTVYVQELSPLDPGPRPAPGPNSNAGAPVHLNFESNAFGTSEGKRLYAAYNCIGCHANGGGGMGPPLMDAKWIYGAEPDKVFETIVKGRPNGMPTFEGKIPDYQVWQIVAYVRSMSGQLSATAAPSRDDHMQLGPPENTRERETPQKVTPPPDVLPTPGTRPATTTTAPTTAKAAGGKS